MGLQVGYEDDGISDTQHLYRSAKEWVMHSGSRCCSSLTNFIRGKHKVPA